MAPRVPSDGRYCTVGDHSIETTRLLTCQYTALFVLVRWLLTSSCLIFPEDCLQALWCIGKDER